MFFALLAGMRRTVPGIWAWVFTLVVAAASAAAQTTYGDRVWIHATDTVRDGSLVSGRIEFEQAPSSVWGRTVYVRMTGSAPIRPGVGIEAVEREAVRDALSRIPQMEAWKNPRVSEWTSVNRSCIEADLVRVRNTYLVGPGITVTKRRVEGNRVSVQLLVPVTLDPVVGRDRSQGIFEAWKEAPKRFRDGMSFLDRKTAEASRAYTTWMNRAGSAVGDLKDRLRWRDGR